VGATGSAISTSSRGWCRRGCGRSCSRPPPPGRTAARALPGPVVRSVLDPSRSTAADGHGRGCPSRGALSSQLPLLEPRSRTVRFPAPTSTSTCRRETSGSVSRTVASLPRPTTCRPRSSGSAVPASGPPTTCSSSALDPAAAPGRGPGRPRPSSAPCSNSGSVSGSSGASRVLPDQSSADGRRSAAASRGRTAPSRSSSRAEIATSRAPLDVTRVQQRVAGERAGTSRPWLQRSAARGPPPDLWTAGGAVDDGRGQEGSGT
jgi:hypothetical protein